MQSSTRSPALEAAAAELVHALGGKWSASGGMCHCPAHEDSTPSLSVRVGSQCLLFKCFAGCAAIDVLRAIRRRRIEIPRDRAGPVPDETLAANARMAVRAQEIWEQALTIEGTLGARYLSGRGIERGSTSLRFHGSTPLGRGRSVRFRPAVIAAVREHGLLVAIQRIFLAGDGPAPARDLARPKLTLGRPLQGAVQLDQAGPVLGLAEGIETALSASILLGIPVWATLGNERLARVALPSVVRRLILLPDADAPGRLAEARARTAYACAGRDIETLWPWGGFNDWNDVLRSGGKGVGSRVRQAV